MAKLMKIFVEWRHETNSAIPALTVAFCFASALDQYGEWQQLESTQMLAEYLHHPDQWYAHHYRHASSVVHRVALGVRVEASSDRVRIQGKQRGSNVLCNAGCGSRKRHDETSSQRLHHGDD